MASLGVKPDLLARAIRILDEAVALMEEGFTTKSRAVDGEDQPIHPTDPWARKWRLDGALIEATRTIYKLDCVDFYNDTIDLTVAYSHPWCGANMAEIVSAKNKPDTIWMTKAISEALARSQQRVLARQSAHLELLGD